MDTPNGGRLSGTLGPAIERTAELHGCSIGAAAIMVTRERITSRSKLHSAGVRWLMLPLRTRTGLLMVATRREDHERWPVLEWHDLTQAEQAAIATEARAWARGLSECAGWLR